LEKPTNENNLPNVQADMKSFLILALFVLVRTIDAAETTLENQQSPWRAAVPSAPATAPQPDIPLSPPSGSGAGVGATVGGGVIQGTTPTVINTPHYYYIVPKAGSRLAQQRALLRAQAAARQSAPYPPQDQLIRGSTTTPAPVASGNVHYLTPPPPADEPEETDFDFAPLHAPPPIQPERPAPILLTRPAPAPAAPPAEVGELRVRMPPISQAGGPLYNDSDPLLEYQKQHAAKGNPQSQYALGMRYLTGAGVEQSDVLARQWLERSSEGGNLRARAELRKLPPRPFP
jgi:hypothetical protein